MSKCLITVLLLLALAGCGQGGDTPSASTETSTSTTPASATPSRDDGYIVKSIGQEGAVTNEDTGDWIMRFRVTAITVDPKCTSGFDEAPANGHYIAISMEFWTTAEVGASDSVIVDPHHWEIVGPDGVTENDSEGSGYSCFPESETLPYSIDGAKHVKGYVVLDSKYTSGKLRFSTADGSAGWQYQLSA